MYYVTVLFWQPSETKALFVIISLVWGKFEFKHIANPSVSFLSPDESSGQVEEWNIFAWKLQYDQNKSPKSLIVESLNTFSSHHVL